MVFRNILLSRIAEPDLALLTSSLTEVSLIREQKLYDVGDVVPHLYFPGTAVVSVVTVMQNGQCVETSTVGFESAPGILSILAGKRSTSRVFTQVPGSALRVPADQVREVAAVRPEFLRLLLSFAEAAASLAELSVACNALHQVQARLARWLLMTQDRVGNHTVPLTQDFLAIMLGVQRTTVSMASSVLKREGLIDYSRGQITVLDREGLSAVACECYRTGRAVTDALALSGPLSAN
jgi:CRP-like cAMP-binding protein